MPPSSEAVAGALAVVLVMIFIAVVVWEELHG